VLVGTPDGSLDADEWTSDVSALFLSRSAVVRIGGRLLVGEGRIPVPRLGDTVPMLDYVRQSADLTESAILLEGPAQAAAEGAAEDPESALWPEQEGGDKTAVRAQLGNLVPSRNELAWKVVLPDGLARDLAEQPEPAWAVKEDIAEALALGVDRKMLAGVYGLADKDVKASSAGAEAIVRAVLAAARERVRSSFRDAGWILSPSSLDALSQLTMEKRYWDSTWLVAPDGEDGGTLLGYPFVATQAAGDHIFFSTDWSEAWIGMRRRVVTVDMSKDAHFQSDETVIRAVSEHDLVLRRPELFIATES
jgi:HK97 family phage major capsid protein